MTRQDFLYEVKDYVNITLGLLLYTFSFTLFLLPYQIVTGGISGIGHCVLFHRIPCTIHLLYHQCRPHRFGTEDIGLEVFDKDHLRHLHADIVSGDLPRHHHHAQWRILQDSGGEQ